MAHRTPEQEGTILDVRKASARQITELLANIHEIRLKDPMDSVFGPTRPDSALGDTEAEIQRERRIRGALAYRFMKDKMSMRHVAAHWDEIMQPDEEEYQKYLQSIVGVKLTTRDNFFKGLKYRLHGAIQVHEGGEWRRLGLDETHQVLQEFDNAVENVNKFYCKSGERMVGGRKTMVFEGMPITIQMEEKCSTAQGLPRTVKFGRAWYYEPEVPVIDKSRRLDDDEIVEELAKLERFRHQMVQEHKSITEPESVKQTIQQSVDEVRRDWKGELPEEIENAVRRRKKNELEIRGIQLSFILDEGNGMITNAEKFVKNSRYNALWALEHARDAVSETYKKMLGGSSDERLKNMWIEMEDAGNLAMMLFTGEPPSELAKKALRNMGEQTILFCPANLDQTIGISFSESPKINATVIGVKEAMNRHLKVIYSERGAVLAHMEGIRGHPFESGDHVIVDTSSDEPTVIFNPTEATKIFYRRKRDFAERIESEKVAEAPLECRTKFVPKRGVKSVTIQLAGNTSDPAHVISNITHGAKGLGLVRGEELLADLTPEDVKSETQLEEIFYQKYSELFKTMRAHAIPEKQGYSITLRALDLGGDKIPHSVRHLFANKDPATYRGLEVLLDNTGLFKAQLKAVLRLAARFDELELIMPLVKDDRDILAINKVFDEAKQELEKRRGDRRFDYKEDFRYGIMVETEESVSHIRLFSGRGIRLFSVGTNDLTCDRLRIEPEDFISGVHDHDPRVVELLDHIVKNAPPEVRDADPATEKHMPLEVCGDMAGTITGAIILAGLGYRKLSMVADSIIPVKRVLRDTPIDVMETIAQDALSCMPGDDVATVVRERMKQLAGINIEDRRYK
ncbi:MAG TPA: hypothetical protein ENN13_01415 [Candidatus Altiarchaeales archaeon]|nr:hypothetical protein [Candidatus Altiarchaeales archaeon]